MLEAGGILLVIGVIRHLFRDDESKNGRNMMVAGVVLAFVGYMLARPPDAQTLCREGNKEACKTVMQEEAEAASRR